MLINRLFLLFTVHLGNRSWKMEMLARQLCKILLMRGRFYTEAGKK